jgi:pSer/pThr/pTyr-binding forkhead associated (FHA) protein
MPQLILSIQGVEIKRVNLVKNRTTLGRKPGNDIVVNDMVVSGEHCAFDLRGLADVYVEDLNSTNGTYLNGKMLHGERPQLVDHDVISVGRIRILFLSASDPGDFGQTTSMSLEGTGLQGGTEARNASLRVLSGSSAGLEVPVVKAVTTFGKPGIAIVAISHRRQGFYVAVMEGGSEPTLNGQPIGPDAVPLSDQDELELAGTRMMFVLKD